MIDHISLRSVDVPALARFYAQATAPLGWSVVRSFGPHVTALGPSHDMPVLWLVPPGEDGRESGPMHLALMAPDSAAVDAFHAAAIAAGATDNGGPGLRAMYGPTYYAAYVIDPAGTNLEAVCHTGA